MKQKIPRYTCARTHKHTNVLSLRCSEEDLQLSWVFVLQSGHHSSVQEEGGQSESKSAGCCGAVQLAGRLEGLQVTPESSPL